VTEDERPKNAEGVRSSELDIPREPEPRVNEASDAVAVGERAEKLADECELELCGYAGECNQCETPTGRTWAKMFRAECEEVSEYVCEKCLPAYHAAYLENLASWIAYADDEIAKEAAGEAGGGRDSASERNGAQGYIIVLSNPTSPK